MGTITFTGPGGIDPVARILQIQADAQPTVGDALAAGQLLRSRILQRTAQGIDVDGVAFAPYSQNHPYYYYPGGAAGKGKLTTQQRQSKAARHGKISGGRRTTKGVRYASYAAFKAAFGRSGVDLFGIQGDQPHMLTSIQVLSGGSSLSIAQEPGIRQNGQPANELRVGFYDHRSASIASGHDQGAGHLPKRHFFDANHGDVADMERLIAGRMLARLKVTR